MTRPSTQYRTSPVQLAVLGVVGLLAGMSIRPSVDQQERLRLAKDFAFSVQPLPAPEVPEGTVHGVNQYAPQLERYVYVVGAALAVGDLDGDGLSDDLCYTDVRAKALVFAPVPGTDSPWPDFSYDFGGWLSLRAQWPTSTLLMDANEDGLTDVVVGFADRAPLLLLRKASDVPGPPTQEAFEVQELVEGGQELAWHSLTMASADVDGDGHQDILVGNYFRDGDRVHDPDANEPFVMNDGFNTAENGGTNRIFLWTAAASGEAPSASFVDAGDVFPGGGERRWTLAIAAGDIDMDGLSDLYMANDHGQDQLLLNRSTPGKVVLQELEGERDWTMPRSHQMGHDTFKGMGADFADINDDGVFDIYVSNIGSEFALMEGHFLWVSEEARERLARGVSPYVNKATHAGVAVSAWAWESMFDDFDNDGVDELVQATGFLRGTRNAWADLANFGLMNDRLVADPRNWPYIHEDHDIDGWDPNPFFVRHDGGLYAELSGELMPGLTPNTRGIATSDVDGDGDLDMMFANIWHDSTYLRNDAPSPGAHLSLHLLHGLEGGAWGVQHRPGHPRFREGTPATGALVRVRHPDGRTRMRQVDGGNGHSGQRSSELHFGLGDLEEGTQVPVEISWRDLEGKPHLDELTLTPGWHVVMLSHKTEPPPPPAEPADLPAEEVAP
jgi:hypothetical protein